MLRMHELKEETMRIIAIGAIVAALAAAPLVQTAWAHHGR
jgi:hypothetical protein